MTQRPDRVVLEYTPEDFYFVSDAAKMPTPGQCDDDSVLTEFQKQLCANKEHVKKVMDQQKVHSGMQQKLYDGQSKYYAEVMKSFNLGIGIIAIISFLYYSQPVSSTA
jgi:hypothetical protein